MTQNKLHTGVGVLEVPRVASGAWPLCGPNLRRRRLGGARDVSRERPSTWEILGRSVGRRPATLVRADSSRSLETIRLERLSVQRISVATESDNHLRNTIRSVYRTLGLLAVAVMAVTSVVELPR
jgi:hypothetical protein